MSIKLPVYGLGRPRVDATRLTELAAKMFGMEKPLPQQRGGRIVVAEQGVSMELFAASGAIFAADGGRLRVPTDRPALPSADEVYALSAELTKRHGLEIDLGAEDFELTRLAAGGTVVATRTGRQRSHHALDVQARFAVNLRNPGIDGEPDLIPMVGGGGKVAFTFGDGGRLLGYHRNWRPVSAMTMVDAIDRDEAAEIFGRSIDHLEVTKISGRLAYFAAPGDHQQEQLTPVWVFGGIIAVGGEQVPLRTVIIAATEFGPVVAPSKPQPVRDRATGGGSRRVHGSITPRAANPSEAGTSWIGSLGGLPGSQQNAQGFVDGLAADGWQVNFNWGNANAFESDWDSDDDSWLDNADFVFYTGHANLNGWLLVTPGTQNMVQLTPAVVGAVPENPGDLWGQQDLEWVVVAACGPLQDDVISAGGGDVLTRWEGAFDGLHTLMGYGSITNDNTDEGRKLAQYTREGTPIIDAWFRTAQEVQPSTNGESAPDGPDVWVGAMYVTKPGADPRGDHIWGHGSVAPDPTSPTSLVCMWTTC